MPLTPVQRAVGRWTGHIIPAILMGAVGYATYVFVVRLCIHYLLFGSQHRRRGAAIAFLVVYFVLLLPMAISYLRLLLIVKLDPGYLPLGPDAPLRRLNGSEKPGGPLRSEAHRKGRRHPGSPNSEVNIVEDPDAPGLEQFYTKDIFVCEFDGRPKYCSECRVWKPDRAHHCSDVERCVEKMDHYCPWVGGVVAEHSFKFFLQFVTYTWIYCFYLLVVVGIYFAEQRKLHSIDPQLAVIIGLAGFFGLFTFVMSGSCFHFCLTNLTTIENLNRKTVTWQLAIYLPRSEHPNVYESGWAAPFPTVTYPLPYHTNAKDDNESQRTHNDDHTVSTRDEKAIRKFAILKMEPGESPWDLGFMNNWKSIMGEKVIDWFLPIKRSPCCNHESNESLFPVGPAVQRLRDRYLRTQIGQNRENQEQVQDPPPGAASHGVEMHRLDGESHGEANTQNSPSTIEDGRD